MDRSLGLQWLQTEGVSQAGILNPSATFNFMYCIFSYNVKDKEASFRRTFKEFKMYKNNKNCEKKKTLKTINSIKNNKYTETK